VNLNIFAKSYADYATAATAAVDIGNDTNLSFPASATKDLTDANIKIAGTGLTNTQKLHQKIDAATGKAVDGQ